LLLAFQYNFLHSRRSPINTSTFLFPLYLTSLLLHFSIFRAFFLFFLLPPL
jgi:hypothetical protein